jgi:GNAT superfamily N-acetyltransferase
MLIREAEITDIPAMHRIRLAEKENKLSNPLAVQEGDYIPFLTEKGKGWICELDGVLVGFAIIDLTKQDVWTLFVAPDMEGKGLGSALHNQMLRWYFTQTSAPLHLGTEASTKAERFYNNRFWEKTGTKPNGDITFIMSQKPLHLFS